MAALWGGTFHSIGNRVLRQHAGLLGYERDFSILDREDARHLINTCLAESEVDTKGDHFPKADVLGDIFSMALNTHKGIKDILQEQHDRFEHLAAEVEDIRQRYVARKRTANAMDFDDLLALWLKLMQEHEEVREQYQRRFQFILVDEYQDTNRLQSDLIDLLAARHKNVMVVGDDAQSIYAWRGANYLNILKFPERYPGAKIYKIETNYRSTPEILKVANAAISANVEQFAKELAPARKPGAKPVLVTCNDASEQAAFVAQRVQELREEGEAMNRMAVLYRSHFHALELQLELTKRGMLFQHHERHSLLRAGAHQRRDGVCEADGESPGRTLFQTPGAVAAGHRRQGRGQALEVVCQCGVRSAECGVGGSSARNRVSRRVRALCPRRRRWRGRSS